MLPHSCEAEAQESRNTDFRPFKKTKVSPSFQGVKKARKEGGKVQKCPPIETGMRSDIKAETGLFFSTLNVEVLTRVEEDLHYFYNP